MSVTKLALQVQCVQIFETLYLEYEQPGHAMDSPPSKAVPPDCPQQNNRSPWTKYHSHTWSPLLLSAACSQWSGNEYHA